MSAQPDLNRFYRSLLAMAALEVSEDGLVSEYTDSGEKMPFFVSGKRLVIPESNQLRAGVGEERVFFHVARENIMLGETKEFATFRKRVNDRMQIRIMAVLAELLVLAASPKLYTKLSGAQLELLRGLEDIDKKTTFEAFKGLLAVTTQGDATQQPFSLYLHKNGKLGSTGHSYRRVAVVSFPLYEQLVKDGLNREEIKERRKEQPKEQRETLPKNETYGVEMGKHNRGIFLRLFEYVFPMIGTKDAYSMGSNSDYFPNLEAFCMAMQGVAECINAVVDSFSELVPTLEGQRIDLSWVEVIANPESLHKVAQQIPDQNMGGAVHGSANQGSPVATMPGVAPEVGASPMAPPLAVLPVTVVQPTPAPLATPAPAPNRRPGEKSLSEIFGSNAPQPMAMPGMVPGIVQPGMVPGMVPGYGAPMMVQPVPGVTPSGQRVYTGGGMPGMPGTGVPGVMTAVPGMGQGIVQPMQMQQPGIVQPGYVTTGTSPGAMMGQPPYGYPNKGGI